MVDKVQTATFQLVMPAKIGGSDNLTAMKYWPFHYPTTRAYRYTYEDGVLRYSVVLFCIAQQRPVSTMVKHIHGTALDKLVQVRKRMARFDRSEAW